MTSDREPPVFPRVGDAEPGPAGEPSGPLFTPAQGAYEAPATESVTAEPVERVGPSPSQSRLRWAVVGVATLLVLAVVGGVLLLAGPRAGTPSLVEYYVPADTAAYMEARLDFPGDQRDRLATFMSHFPGFADPQAFQRKIDESLDSLLRSTNAGVDWTNDVAPWFGGEIAVFGESISPGIGTPPQMVVALTVKDRPTLEAFLNGRLADHDVDTLDHQGQQIRTFTPDPGTDRVSFVVTDELLLVSPRVESIQAALDVKAGVKPALAADQFFLQQLGALHSDRLATAYYDMGRVIDAAQPGTSEGLLGIGCADALQSGARVKYVAEVRAEGDHMAITTRAQAPTGNNVPPLPQNRASVLTSVMPASAIAYFEARQVGATVRATVAQFLDCLEQSGTPFDGRAIEQFLGTAPEDYLDFVGDAGIALTYDNNTPGGGLIATVDDETVARQRLERLLASVRAFASFGGAEGITVEDVEHNGVTITVFSFSNLPPGMPPASLAVAVANGRLYVGLNDFVTAALDRQPADSLASSAGLQQALASGGSDNAGFAFVDVARARALLEASMPAEEQARYETDIKPFIEPLSSMAMVNRVDNGILVGNVFLYVE